MIVPTRAPGRGEPLPTPDARPALAADLCLLAVALTAGLGAARLTRTPGAMVVVGPIIATTVTGHFAASAARRLRLDVALVALTGTAAVALATIWGTVPATTWSGLPTVATWHALQTRFSEAGSVIRGNPTPLPATPGVVLCLAAGAGLVAVLGRALWAWQEIPGAGTGAVAGGGAGVRTRVHPRPRPLVALLPSFGLFCYTSLLSSQVDREAGALWYVGSALVFVIAADRAVAGGGRHRTPRVVLRDALPTLFTAALAVAVPLAASPALGALKLNALPFPTAPGHGGLGLASGVTGVGENVFGAGSDNSGVRTIDLVDDLGAVLSSRTTEVMFSATTAHPTYWQLAVLTRFDGTEWLPDQFTQAAALNDAVPVQRSVQGLPVLPEPSATTSYDTTVTIADLQSTLLPLPPTTESVGRSAQANFITGFGAVRAFEAPPALTYTATARVPVTVKATGPGAATPYATVAPSLLAPYLQLPATEPNAVVQLAHQIVAGASGPAAEAAALARWFNSGRFHYSLSPPLLTGPDPLASFLFTTRTGFCQQFAAAYAVLARIDGLATRVAVGFTTGTSSGHDRYRITGADAHVWPEVYLGPAVGWTSFEPTPATTGEPSGLGVDTGTRATVQKPGPNAGHSTATSLPNLRRPPTPGTSPVSTAPRPLAGHGVTGSSSSSSTPTAAIVGSALVGALTLFLGWRVRRRRRSSGDDPGTAAPWTAKRRWRPMSTLRAWRWRLARAGRHRRRPRTDPTGDVLAQWHEAEKVLDRARLGKRPAETIDEHAARLRALAGSRWLAPPSSARTRTGAEIGSVTGIEAAVAAYAGLADLAARASYGADGCTPEDADAAQHLGVAVRTGLDAGTRRVPSASDRSVRV